MLWPGWRHPWSIFTRYECGKCAWTIETRADVAEEAFRFHLMDHDLEQLLDEELNR